MDILIYTEVDNRELDAACLIMVEMKKRGYSAEIKRYNRICEAGSHLRYKPKMLILPWLYDEDFLFNFINDNNNGKLKIVNLQSEQILSENFIKNNYHMPKKRCVLANHLAWGDATKERFLKADIPEDNILKVGNINLDFNSQKFLDVYYNKKELAELCDLNYKKEWVIFISSFTHPSMSEEERSSYIRRFPFLKEFVDISVQSQKTLIGWFERFAKENPEKEFIYRPHPTELKNKTLMELSDKYDNFNVINSYSLRQWVKVCEHNTTWFSTSIADVFYQNKDCAILRPLVIPRNADCELFYDCDSISDYNGFVNFVNRNEVLDFPIKKEKFDYYYGTNECGTNYKIFCDYLEKILKSDNTMPTLELDVKTLSKIRRNAISFLFSLNNHIKITGLPFIKNNVFMHDQMEEKRNSHKWHIKSKKNLLSKLKGLI